MRGNYFYDFAMLDKDGQLPQAAENRAIYSTAAGEIIYDVSQARPGYGWQGSYFDKNLETEIRRLISAPPDKRHQRNDKPNSRSLNSLQQRAQSAIDSLDEEGRWLSPLSGSMRNFYLEAEQNADPTMQSIHSGTFQRNIEILIDYLEAVK